MNKLTKSLVAAGLMAGMSAPVLADGLSGNVSLVSDYIWRGVQQSPDAEPTMQGGMDYATGNWSFGTWGSSLNFGTEIDVYGSYNFGPVTVGAIYYYFPFFLGSGGSTEVNIGGDVGPVSLMASYSVDSVTTPFMSGNPYYLEASYSYPMTKAVSLDLHGGYGTTYTDNTGGAVFDYSVGVSGSVGKLELAAVYAYSGADAFFTGPDSGHAYVSMGTSF
jgi:uncharacterized protein (TIGR02001 family)